MTDPSVLPRFSPTLAERLQKPPPDFLHHYTGQDGLLGILKSPLSLWASNISYLNDWTEFDRAVGMLRDRLARTHENSLSEHASRLLGIVDHFRSVRDLGIGSSVCVACFCKDDDLLSQWRGYAGHGYGYSLAFDTSVLKEKAKACGFILGECIYETEFHEEILDDAAKFLLTPPTAKKEISDDLFHVLNYLPFFKHYSFREEKEWRLVSLGQIDLWKTEFRRGKSMIIPYTSIPVGEGEGSALCGVRVGPCPHKALSVASVRKMLAQQLIPPTMVEGSSIPFRDW
jgi:Protein of unknown function (DUF2971)